MEACACLASRSNLWTSESCDDMIQQKTQSFAGRMAAKVKTRVHLLQSRCKIENALLRFKQLSCGLVGETEHAGGSICIDHDIHLYRPA